MREEEENILKILTVERAVTFSYTANRWVVTPSTRFILLTADTTRILLVKLHFMEEFQLLCLPLF